MKVLVYTLGNSGHQPVSVAIQALPIGATAAGDVPSVKTGMLTIEPGTKVTIEASRVNDGQIVNLKSTNFITATQSYLTPT
jgi:hypothetical protein